MVGLIELYLEKTNERSRDRKPGSSSVIQNFSYSSRSPTSSPLSASSFPSFTSSSSSSTSSISFPSVNNTFSCLLNGEFYYDEDFSVPFDANLTETRRQVAPPPRVFSLSPLGGSPPSPREIQITWSRGGGGGGEASDLFFPYLTTSDVTGHDNDDVGGRVRWLGEGGGSQQPFGSLDSIQGNENDFASRSTSPDRSSTSAGDVIIVDVGKNKRTNRYPVGENSDDEIIPKLENDCRNSQEEAVTTWAGLCREKVDSNQMLGCRESSDSSEISKISHRQRNWGIIDDERKISNGDVIIENLLTWGQIKERPKISLEIQRSVEVEEDEEEDDDDDEDETVSRLKDSTDNDSKFGFQSHPFPVVMETSPVALETAFHKQSDDDVEVPAAMTTWQTIRASSRNGFHGDRPSGSGEVSDSLSLEGQRSSSGGRRELTSSPSSKDDGYDSVTLKDLSYFSEGHVSYQLLLGDGEASSSDSETGGLIRTLRSSEEDLSQVFAIAKDNSDFDSSRSDPDPELSNSTGSLNVSTSGRAKRTEPEVHASDPEFQKSITSEDAENHDHHHHRHLKSFYDSLAESVHSTSFRIFFESASDSVATGSLPPRGFADRSTQTSDQSSEFDSSGRNGSGKPSDGSRLRKLYSINTPLPDLSFLAKRKQQDRKDKSCTINNSKSSSISAMSETSGAPVILQNTQIDSSEHRNLDQIASFQSSKPGRSCKVFGPLRNQSGLHELSKEISFSTPLKPDSRTIYEDLNPVVLDNIKPENEENVDGKNIMERLVIEVCGSCQRRTVHIKNERLETNSMNTFIESLSAKDLTSRQGTKQNKSDDAKSGLLLNPMRTTESPAPNCTRQNLLSDAIRAVELLLLHFDQDRRDKEQLGSTCSDSEIGVLVLRYLCPALSSILTDGLKPELRSYVGNVKNNVRNLIEDSVTLVGLPSFFQGIVSSLKRLKCLKAPPMFFNAFIFALLNCRVLDVWLSCVVSNALLLERHYTAESILRQSDEGSLRLIHEFLAFLQPLSLLPFSIEYDFEARVIENVRKHQAQSTGAIQRYLSHRTHAPSSTFGGRSFLEAEEIISF